MAFNLICRPADFEFAVAEPMQPAPARPVVSWKAGADGQQRLGPFLDEAFADTGVVLHDRLVVDDAKRSNIDHLVVVSSGVWIIEATNNQNEFIDGLVSRTAAVRRLLEPMGLGLVPVHPVLCIVKTDRSQRSSATVIDGVLVLSPDKLCSVAAQPGFVNPDAVDAIGSELGERLPAAANH